MDGFAGGSGSGSGERERPRRRGTRNDDDDLEYKLALEASKNEAEEDARRRANKGPVGGEDDDDLQKAIRLSREEEELRKRELEEANANSLFDDTPTQQPQPTGFNQGYQQGAAVDWFANPMEGQQQPQSTGYLNNAYSQPTGVQPQQTGFQNGYGYAQYQQPQQTAFDSAFQSQPQNQFVQPQQTGYNPWAAQMNTGFDQPQQQQTPVAQTGSNNPWATASPTQSLGPQPTGSNNPFASSFSRPQPSAQRAPTLSTLAEQKTATPFQPSYTPNPITSFQPSPSPAQQPQQQQVQQPMDPHRAQLNALLSSGEGQDTFGNVGNLRIPAQHTAPGTFVNSAGQGINKLEIARTGMAGGGSNPFLQSQYTGMPQQQFPAQTGPANAFGGAQSGFGGAPNPFAQQQRQGGGQGGSLIDL